MKLKAVALAGMGIVLASTLVASGCATKRYGRMQAVSGVEKQHYTCEDIEIELAKIVEFRRQIAEGSEINVASVGGFLGDLGIGNTLEKNAAEKTATDREAELLELKAEKGC